MLQRIWNDMKVKATIAAYQKEEQRQNENVCVALGDIGLTKLRLKRDLDTLAQTPKTPYNVPTMRSLASDCVLLKRKLQDAHQRHEAALHKAMQARAMVDHLTNQRCQGQTMPTAVQPPAITDEELLTAHATQSAFDDAFVLLQQADTSAPVSPEDKQEIEDLLSGYTSTQAYLPTHD